MNTIMMNSFLCASSYHHHHGSLMHNQSMIVDPNFPPAEEYNQNNYISSDFFNNHHHQPPHQYDGYFRQTTPNIPENPYMNHNAATVQSPPINYGSYAPPSQDAYQLPQHLPPPSNDAYQLPQHLPPQPPPPPPQQPQHQPDLPLIRSESLTSQIKELHSTPHSGDSSCQSEQDELDGDEYSASGLSDHDGSPRTDSPEKIIYPWMKKVHVAGYGELFYKL